MRTGKQECKDWNKGVLVVNRGREGESRKRKSDERKSEGARERDIATTGKGVIRLGWVVGLES